MLTGMYIYPVLNPSINLKWCACTFTQILIYSAQSISQSIQNATNTFSIKHSSIYPQGMKLIPLTA